MWWVDVLNEALEWSHFEKAQRLAQANGAHLSAAAHGHLVADAALMRRTFAVRALGRPAVVADEQVLLQWLQTVTMKVATPLDSTGNSAVRLMAVRGDAALPAPFEQKLGSALLQLLATVSEPGVFHSVQRCHGVTKRHDVAAFLAADFEAAFAERAGLQQLLEFRSTETSWSQCPVLVYSERGRHFCSKACSNATFAARKALEDPHYFAVKQERYRSKQQASTDSNSGPKGEGAFVYMD